MMSSLRRLPTLARTLCALVLLGTFLSSCAGDREERREKKREAKHELRMEKQGTGLRVAPDKP